jgi:hypothetical protein
MAWSTVCKEVTPERSPCAPAPLSCNLSFCEMVQLRCLACWEPQPDRQDSVPIGDADREHG